MVGLATVVARRTCRPFEEFSVSLPPLVEPAAELTIDEVRRYSRHLIIPDVGMSGQKRLKNSRVLVIGAGGLGSPLSRSGRRWDARDRRV
jgi:sulfur-carrier protein adenylyltransferase/sulfurtransferase